MLSFKFYYLCKCTAVNYQVVLSGLLTIQSITTNCDSHPLNFVWFLLEAEKIFIFCYFFLSYFSFFVVFSQVSHYTFYQIIKEPKKIVLSLSNCYSYNEHYLSSKINPGISKFKYNFFVNFGNIVRADSSTLEILSERTVVLCLLNFIFKVHVSKFSQKALPLDWPLSKYLPRAMNMPNLIN